MARKHKPDPINTASSRSRTRLKLGLESASASSLKRFDANMDVPLGGLSCLPQLPGSNAPPAEFERHPDRRSCRGNRMAALLTSQFRGAPAVTMISPVCFCRCPQLTILSWIIGTGGLGTDQA